MNINLMDGAMGTVISDVYKLEGECREKFNVIYPNIIEEIHERYIQSGSDYIKANTFNCSKESLKYYGENPKNSYQYAFEGARIAKKVAMKYGVKSIGTFCIGDKDQIEGIIDGGIDIILLETIYDLNKGIESLEILQEILKNKGVSKNIMISFTTDEDGRLFSGEYVIDIFEKFIKSDVVSIGINCSYSKKKIKKILKLFREKTKLLVSFHPNIKDDEEEIFEIIGELIEDRVVDVLGGCCRTEFDYIKKLKTIIDGVPDEI